MEQLPGLAVQELMAQGYGFGPEGDWKSALLIRTLKAMSVGLPGGTSLMEDYTYHLVDGEQKILGAHMLEICPTITSSVPRIEIHPLSLGGKADPVRLVFDADPAAGLVLSLVDLRDRFRFTANTIDIVGPDQPLDNLPVASAVWVPRPDFETAAEAWLMAGGAHHTALTTSVGRAIIEDFTRIAQTELLMIDESTTVRAFEREIRWNQAYFRLAQGL